MVKGGNQLDRPGSQHPVAEHVARHVADADHAEWLRLDVDVHLAEMPLDALPRTARRDPHALVVVARRAAGGEGISEPVVVLKRNFIGEIGEGRRALVSGHDEIWVIAIVPDHAIWRDDLSGHDIVRDVEHRGDERPVGSEAFLRDFIA